TRNGNLIPINGLTVLDQKTDLNGEVQVACTSTRDWSIPLETDKFYVTSGGKTYAIDFQVDCGYKYQLVFEEASLNGQAISIFEIFQRGRTKLEEAVGLDFWRQRMRVIWPSDGDYYGWGGVN